MPNKSFIIDAASLAGGVGAAQGTSSMKCYQSPGVFFVCHGDGGGGSYTCFSYHFWWVDIFGARGTPCALYHTICDDQRRIFPEQPPRLEFLQDEENWSN